VVTRLAVERLPVIRPVAAAILLVVERLRAAVAIRLAVERLPVIRLAVERLPDIRPVAVAIRPATVVRVARLATGRLKVRLAIRRAVVTPVLLHLRRPRSPTR